MASEVHIENRTYERRYFRKDFLTSCRVSPHAFDELTPRAVMDTLKDEDASISALPDSNMVTTVHRVSIVSRLCRQRPLQKHPPSNTSSSFVHMKFYFTLSLSAKYLVRVLDKFIYVRLYSLDLAPVLKQTKYCASPH